MNVLPMNELVRTRTTARSQAANEKRAAKRTARELKAQRHQQAAGYAVWSVTLVLTALSLTHLSDGIALITGAPCWECWAEAVAIDCGFVAMELSLILAVDKVRKHIVRWASPTITLLMAGSAALNACAFWAGSTGWMQYPAIVFGVAIPALIYALMKVGTKMVTA